MKLHRAGVQADWNSVAVADRNFWQQLAVHTSGIVTPGNAISMLGILLVGCGLVVMSVGSFWQGLLLLVVGRVADVLDGIVAERTATKSPLGEMVDAILDKVAAIAVLVLFIVRDWAPLIPMLLIALQMVVNSVLASIAHLRRSALHPSPAGKKSAVVAWAIILVFALATAAQHSNAHAAFIILNVVGYVLTIAFAVLAVQTVAGYSHEVPAPKHK